MADLEEGELDNSDPEDLETTGKAISSTYKVLERPVSSVPMSAGGQQQGSYRSRITNASSDSNSDDNDDDDGDSGLWKKKQEKFFRKQHVGMDTAQPSEQLSAKPVKKVNNVWGSVLTEQDLTQTLVKSVNVDRGKEFDYNERNVESYDYTKKYQDTRPAVQESDKVLSDMIHDPFESVLKSATVGRSVVDYEDTVDKSHNKKRGKKRKSEYSDRGGKSVYDRLGPKKMTTMSVADLDMDTEMEATALVDKIADALNEPKKELIERVVEHLGKEVAIRVLNFTRDVEKGGGMLTFDGSRRRTAGGVYIQLLKQQPELTSDKKKEVFKEEHERELTRRKEKKKRKQKNRRRQKAMDGTKSRSSSRGSKGAKDSGEEMDDDCKDRESKDKDNEAEKNDRKLKGHNSRRSRHDGSSDSESSDDDRYSERRKNLSFEEELANARKRIEEQSKAAEMVTNEGDESKENLEDSNDLDAQEDNVVDIPLDG